MPRPPVPLRLLRSPRPAVLVLPFLLAIAGCGLRADERPQPIPRERLDERLFEAGTDAPAGSRGGTIYVLDSQDRTSRLVRVPVRVPAGVDESQAALATLLTWAPPADRAGSPRLSSMIPYGTTLREVRRDGDVLTVDLAHLSIEGTGQTQAAAQIVYTATELPGVEYVRVYIDGKPVSVPLEERSSAPGERLSRGDFPSSLRPEPPASTSTTHPTVAPSTTEATAGTAP